MSNALWSNGLDWTEQGEKNVSMSSAYYRYVKPITGKMDEFDTNNGNNWDNNGTWNIVDDNVADNFFTWPDNNNTTESPNWDTPDDNTVVASPTNNFLDESFNWSNNDFDDFFENSLERFKNDLLRVFTDFYYEWQGPSSEKTLPSRNEQKQIVNVNEIDGELVIHGIIRTFTFL
ncbi:23545_t:CDS:2 [Cetraspora pellucida]|uniref:23545_t:CDS:1 n=1 Tax=Cetraspora pellucida TaxID=1433469 RepID=A0A9N9BD04_9GLOM|nr:23545_t:CDS:2 [Cetraspora pellucida]